MHRKKDGNTEVVLVHMVSIVSDFTNISSKHCAYLDKDALELLLAYDDFLFTYIIPKRQCVNNADYKGVFCQPGFSNMLMHVKHSKA